MKNIYKIMMISILGMFTSVNAQTGVDCGPTCFEVVVENNTNCSLEFTYVYTATVPCGKIIPAINTSNGTNIVPKNNVGTIEVFEKTFQPCGDNTPVCGCPEFIFDVVGGIPCASGTCRWGVDFTNLNATVVTGIYCGLQIKCIVMLIGTNRYHIKFFY